MPHGSFMSFSRWTACCGGASIQNANGAIHLRLNYRSLEAFQASDLIRIRSYSNDKTWVAQNRKTAIPRCRGFPQQGANPNTDVASR